MAKVVIVEDDPVFQSGLRVALEGRGVQVLGVAETGETGLTAVEQFSPDVVFLDLRLGGENGLAIAPQIKNCEIILLTSLLNPEQANTALSIGIKGLCLKGISIDRLIEAIECVMRGDRYVDPDIIQTTVQKLGRDRVRSLFDEDEYKVLNWIVRGCTNQEIATLTKFSEQAVKKFVQIVVKKLYLKTN